MEWSKGSRLAIYDLSNRGKWDGLMKPTILANNYDTLENGSYMGHQGVWGKWMRCRYVKNQQLATIAPKANNTINWKASLKLMEVINRWMECNSQGRFSWKGSSMSPSLHNIWETIHPQRRKDPILTSI